MPVFPKKLLITSCHPDKISKIPSDHLRRFYCVKIRHTPGQQVKIEDNPEGNYIHLTPSPLVISNLVFSWSPCPLSNSRQTTWPSSHQDLIQKLEIGRQFYWMKTSDQQLPPDFTSTGIWSETTSPPRTFLQDSTPCTEKTNLAATSRYQKQSPAPEAQPSSSGYQ